MTPGPLRAWPTILIFAALALCPFQNRAEPLAACSRKTPIVISEFMYKPAPRTDGRNIEFIELYNSNPWFHDISGYQLVADNLSYTFPQGTVIQSNAFMVVAAVPADIQAVYAIANVIGPYTGSLKKSGTIQLLDEQGAVLLTIPYSNLSPWPVAAYGAGHSLVLANPTYGEGDPRAWDISDVVGGSPGQSEGFVSSPLRSVVINEFLAHTDPPDVDYIELYNHSTQAVDISGCILTDDPATNKFIIPSTTIIPARGFVYYTATNMNFALSAAGESIYFKNPAQTRVLDAVQFDAQEHGVATGRWPDGANQFYRLTAKTPGTNNATILISQVVINEFMYHPISGNDDDQYVELYNRGTNQVDLSNWTLADAISYTFPSNTVLAPDGYLVVARNAARLRTNYANLNLTNCLGDFSGKLSGKGEHLALTMFDTLTSTNGGGPPVTNVINITVDDVTYATGGRWGQWSDGGGSSLERIDPGANPRLAANWADSDETAKSSWTNIETTGVLDNGANYGSSISLAQIGLLDVGECLVDNVEVRSGTSGANLVANSDFESGLGNWALQGCFVRSSQESSGYSSSHSLHIRCSDRLWTGVNSCQATLNANSLASGQTATLRFKARWLRGWPEVLLRLNGNWLEATGPLPVPANLGTPGARNSRYVTNAGPAVYEVTHSPAVPAASQAVVVTARVQDPNGVESLVLNYRIDPSSSYTAVTMKDDGTGGDAIAGDGLFSATIPGQSTNKIVAFYISATDSNAVTARFPALVNDNAPVHECLVMFGDGNPGGSFGVYHLWISQTNATIWANVSELSNESHDSTFVNGSRVIYNMQGRFAGSPYHQLFDTPYGSLCHYKFTFPDDDKFLGATSFNKIHQPGDGPGDDSSLQREQLANTFLRTLGVPWLNRRYVAVYVNGNRRGTLMEDTQVPDGDTVDEHFPNDADGYLYKMQPWFEFAAAPSGGTIGYTHESWCDLMPFTTTGGVKKPARYRFNFEIRRTPDSANNFTNVFSLVDAAGSYTTSSNYVASMENLADMENWMRVFAANHAAGNIDVFGSEYAQNLFGYIGTLGTKYTLMMWDFNEVFDHGRSTPGGDIFSVNSEDPNTAHLFDEPAFRRMYWRALKALINGPLNVANSGPLLDAKYNAFVANGLSVENPNTNIKPWITSARSSITSQLAAEDTSSFTVSAPVLSNNVAVISGTAPVDAQTIWFNGVTWPITWTGVTTWTVLVPLHAGTNQFSVVGVDTHGQPISGETNNVSAVYNGTVPSPVGNVVLNEIMYNPLVAGAEYVELYNNSAGVTFDLSGWEFQGLSYTFPQGSAIAPKSFLVLAANGPAFAAAYGATIPVFDTFEGIPPLAGETLALVKPGTNSQSNLTVTEVQYENRLPWPTNANGTGAALQLIDSTRDNWRVGNWAAVSTNASVQPQWVYVTATGTNSSSLLYIYLDAAGDLYIDDLKLVSGSVPEAGANLVADGDFESGFPGPWTVSANLSGSALSATIKHSGNDSLHVVASSGGTSQSTAIWQTISPALTVGQTSTISFWYLQNTNPNPPNLIVRLSGSGIVANVDPAPNAGAFTPGIANVVAASLPAFAPLWLNELQADNLTGPTNSAGQRTPWLELYNPTTNAVSLNSLFLANSYTNLTAWAFPTNAVINPGQFKVIFADGQTNLSTTNELHTAFTLPSGTGSLALSRLYNGQPQVLDFIDYANLGLNHSYGSFPDGQSFSRQEFFYVTPGGTNNGSSAPLTVRINEWMAGNTHTIQDPLDGNKYDDWFELYNYGTNTVNLAGYYLTHALTNVFEFQIPSGYTIPPHGFLLVWADKKTPTGSGDLHTNFKLTKSGTSIGLFGADGNAVDFVSFGAQTSDISQGLYPDGGTAVYFMPTPTPRTNNVVNNAGPVLPPQTPVTINELTLLTVTNTATDTNNPAAVLSYTLAVTNLLDNSVVTNAAISTNGIITWTPTEAQGPGTNVFTTVVSDGVLTATNAFTVVVNEVNTAPALAPIGDRLVILGQILTFTASATDTDLPPQTLTFSLGPGAPAGAAIDPSSGQFSWAPASAPSTNAISVIVTDNGAPNLNASQGFTVTVLSPPLLSTLKASGTQFTLSWSSALGETYQIEYSGNLSFGAWAPWGDPLPGTGNPIVLTNDFSATNQFFRVRILP